MARSHFWAIADSTPVLTAVALSILPLADFWFGVAPPWPEHAPVIVASMLVPAAVFSSMRPLVLGHKRSTLERALIATLIAGAGTTVAYIFTLNQFVHQLPDRWNRDVGGWVYTEKARIIQDMNPGITAQEILARLDNEPTLVYESATVGVARAVLLTEWFALMVELNLVAVFVVGLISDQATAKSKRRTRYPWQPNDIRQLSTLVDRNAVELETVLKSAAQALGSSFGEVLGRDLATGVCDVAAAIYEAVRHTTQLRYDYEPANPGESVQEVRLAAEVLTNGCGTCIDLALLYAALLERAHLAPVILILEANGSRHAIAGFFDRAAETKVPCVLEDPDMIAELIRLESLIPVEATGLSVSRAKKMSFARAREAGLSMIASSRLLGMLNVLAARGLGSKPPS